VALPTAMPRRARQSPPSYTFFIERPKVLIINETKNQYGRRLL